MTTNQNELGLEELIAQNTRRRKLIPLWIKIFIWIFMIMGAIAPIILLFTASGGAASLALYGLETTEPYSSIGLLLCGLFFLKGVAAYSLWSERSWAIKLGIVEALLGILICIAVMILPASFNQTAFTFRLELVALAPYLSWLIKIRKTWESPVNT